MIEAILLAGAYAWHKDRAVAPDRKKEKWIQKQMQGAKARLEAKLDPTEFEEWWAMHYARLYAIYADVYDDYGLVAIRQ